MVSKAAEKGRLDAQDEHDAKLFSNKGKKHLEASIANHLGKLIDRIDPFKALAVLATTYAVKTLVIDTTDAILTKITAAIEKPVPFGFGSIMGQYIPYVGEMTKIGEMAWERLRTGDVTATVEEKEGAAEWFKWIIAFAVAYMLVEHGGELLGLGQNVSVLVGMLLA